MDVHFSDPKLATIETEQADQTKLPVPVIKSVRRKLTVIRAATDERTLRDWKSLHYEKLQGDLEGYRSIRVNDKYRMVFTIDTTKQPNAVTVISVEDYHK
jgi:toxin HigB-1